MLAAALTLSLVPSAVVAAVRHLAAQSFRRTAADPPHRTPPGLPPVPAILPAAFAAAAVVASAAVALLLAPDCLSVLEIRAGVVAVVPVLSGPVLVVVDLAAVVVVLSVPERMMIRCRRKATEHPFRSWCRRCKTFFLHRRKNIQDAFRRHFTKRDTRC